MAASRTGDLIGEPSYYLTHGCARRCSTSRSSAISACRRSRPSIRASTRGSPAAETLLTLPTQFILPDAPREGIVINYGELRLYHFRKDEPVQTYAIGVGRDGFELKFGQTKIVRKKEKPTWYPTESTRRDKPEVGTVVPPGPDNPLGEYAMYLGWPTYLIHGTNKPYGVGRRVSRGCIRMYPAGVERLFAEVPVGTPVTAVDQLVKAGWHRASSISRRSRISTRSTSSRRPRRSAPRPITAEDRQLIAGPGRARGRPDRLERGRGRAGRAGAGMPVQITRPRAGGIRRQRRRGSRRRSRRAAEHPARRRGRRDLLSGAQVFPRYPQDGSLD